MQLTQEQFIRLLHVIAKDDIETLRRACQVGRLQLTAQGWKPRPGDEDGAIDDDDDDNDAPASPTTAPPPLPLHAPTPTRPERRSGATGPLAPQSRGIRKVVPTALARVRAQQLAAATANDACDQSLPHPSL